MRVRHAAQRMGLIAAIAALSIGVGVERGVSSAATPTATSDWAQTDASGSDSQANPDVLIPNAADIRRVHYVRSVTAPPGSPRSRCTPGAIDPLLVGNKLYDISTDGISAYSAASGTLKWHTTIDSYGTTVYGGLAVADGVVLVVQNDACETNDPNGAVSAYDATTGKQLWAGGFGIELDTMAVSGSTVVATGSNFEDGSVVGAFDVTTGQQLWATYSEDCPQNALVVAGQAIYEDCSEPTLELVAADVRTGAVTWTKPGSWTIERGDSDGADGLHLYATSDSGEVTDINPKDGTTRFTLAGATRTLAVDNSQVYATCTQGLCAYDRATGALDWGRNAVGGRYVDTDAVAIGGTLLYTANGVVVDAATGKYAGTLGTQDASQIAVGGGRVAIAASGRVIDLYGLAGS